MHEPEPLVEYISSGDLRQYGLVINSAMFEHVRKREELERINDLVAKSGILMIHTVVCENIPRIQIGFISHLLFTQHFILIKI